MANKKINELSTRTPSLSDLMLVGDPSSGYSYKCTITSLATIIETDIADGYVTLGTTQTITGAKTFSNNLTLTSVSNAGVDTDKFLVLNGSNIVNFRTGTEVLSDIGGQGALTLTTTGTSGAATLVGNTLNIPQYQGAITLTTTGSSGSATLVGNTLNVPTYTAAGLGAVTSVALSTGTTGTDVNVSGSPITSSGTITLNIPTASATNTGKLSSTDWSTFNNKQNAITLTTTGTSGAATLVGSTLNIPQYQAALTNPITGTGLITQAAFFTGTNTIAGSSVLVLDGSNIAIGQAAAAQKLSVNGDVSIATINNATTDTDKFLVSDGGVIKYRTGAEVLSDIGGQAALTNPVTGTGTTNYLPKFTGSTSIGNSQLLDNGTTVFLGTSGSLPNVKMNITTSTQRALELISSSGNALFAQSTSGTNVVTITNGTWFTQFTSSGRLDLAGDLLVNTIANATTDTDKFLVSDGGVVKYRTGSEVLSDIGAAASTSISGTTNYIPKFTSSSAIGNSQIFDNGTNVGIGTAAPNTPLSIVANHVGGQSILKIQPTTAYASGGLSSIGFNNSNGTRMGLIYHDATGLQLETGTALPILFNPNGNLRMTLDASGNLGLGVTPSAWLNVLKVIDIGAASLFGQTTGGGTVSLGDNGFLNSSTNWIYKYNGFSTKYDQSLGEHRWFNAPSGTAGNAISFTQAMTLDASGRLGIGTTSLGTSKLYVLGDATNYGITSEAPSGYGKLILKQTSGQAWSIGLTSNDLFFYYGGTSAGTRVTFANGGNVGIGTTNPAVRLDVRTSANTTTLGNSRQLSLWHNGSGIGARAEIGFGYSTGTFQPSVIGSIAVADAGGGAQKDDIYFATRDVTTDVAPTERMRITSGGNVGIGTSSPSTQLQVNGTPSTDWGNLTLFDSRSAAIDQGGMIALAGYKTSTSAQAIFAQIVGRKENATAGNEAGYLAFLTNNNTAYAERMRITSGGNVQIATGSIQTGDPSGGTKKPWKFGAATVTSVSHYGYAQVEIDGVSYYVGLVTAD